MGGGGPERWCVLVMVGGRELLCERVDSSERVEE